ncbi:MAG TPA: hypothetical protein VE573_02070 [Nitrososphaeraceae archaeon]|nr:hypothetical protein [Nitrososphaeraceae archaeon]
MYSFPFPFRGKYAREKIKAKQGNESHNIYDAISQSMCYLEAEQDDDSKVALDLYTEMIQF